MTYYITHIKDAIGNNYLGIDVPKNIIQPYLDELKEIIGEDDYRVFTENQIARDGGHYHITVINVSDYNRLVKQIGMDTFVNSLNKVFEYGIDDLKFMGVGTATKNENRAWFIVVNSDKLDAIRVRYELPKQDFHITLGFKWKDVFGVRKNEVVEKKSKFLKLLEIEYYKNENWNFIKRISNWSFSPDSKPEPVDINDKFILFKVEGWFINVGLADDEEFRIFNKYPIDRERPTLSQNQIAKLFKNKN